MIFSLMKFEFWYIDAAGIPALIISTSWFFSRLSNCVCRYAGQVNSFSTPTPNVVDPPMAKIRNVLSGFSLENSSPLKPYEL